MGILRNTPRPMIQSLRVLAHLLSYPGAELLAHLPECRAALRDEQALTETRLAEIERLIDHLDSQPALACEAAYVELFDRGRGTALHLFEHVHGDSRDRGPAMVDLAKTYEAAGLYLTPGELPDYLPTVLQYASTQPPAQARAFLSEIAHIVQTILSALIHHQSPYASVPAALLELAGEVARPIELAPEPAVDETWQEPPAFDGCSIQGQARAKEYQPIQIVRRQSANQQIAKPGRNRQQEY